MGEDDMLSYPAQIGYDYSTASTTVLYIFIIFSVEVHRLLTASCRLTGYNFPTLCISVATHAAV